MNNVVFIICQQRIYELKILMIKLRHKSRDAKTHTYINWINTRDTRMQRFHHNLHSWKVYRSDQWEKRSQRELLFSFYAKRCSRVAWIYFGYTYFPHFFFFRFAVAWRSEVNVLWTDIRKKWNKRFTSQIESYTENWLYAVFGMPYLPLCTKYMGNGHGVDLSPTWLTHKR